MPQQHQALPEGCGLFISPLLFATKLLAYSVTRSKLALNINGKLHPTGGHTSVRNWLNSLTMSGPDFPPGDVLRAIDNVQVVIKKVDSEERQQGTNKCFD